jgi:hypothetical protein
MRVYALVNAASSFILLKTTYYSLLLFPTFLHPSLLPLIVAVGSTISIEPLLEIIFGATFCGFELACTSSSKTAHYSSFSPQPALLAAAQSFFHTMQRHGRY